MRDLIDSALIGSLASFLPFWIWDSRADQITGAIALSGVIYVFDGGIYGMQNEKGSSELQLRRIQKIVIIYYSFIV